MEGLTPRLTAGRLLRQTAAVLRTEVRLLREAALLLRHRITEAAVEAAVLTAPEALRAGVPAVHSGVPVAAHPTAVAECHEDADSLLVIIFKRKEYEKVYCIRFAGVV